MGIEDRHRFEEFVEDLHSGKFKVAGVELGTFFRDIVREEDVSSSSIPMVAIANGIMYGFSVSVDTKCFQDGRVELPELTDGIKSLEHLNIPEGIVELLRVLEGGLPLYKDCKA